MKFCKGCPLLLPAALWPSHILVAKLLVHVSLLLAGGCGNNAPEALLFLFLAPRAVSAADTARTRNKAPAQTSALDLVPRRLKRGKRAKAEGGAAAAAEEEEKEEDDIFGRNNNSNQCEKIRRRRRQDQRKAAAAEAKARSELAEAKDVIARLEDTISQLEAENASGVKNNTLDSKTKTKIKTDTITDTITDSNAITGNTKTKTDSSVENTSFCNWDQFGSDIDGEAASDWSGYSVALSANGTIVAIGAPGETATTYASSLLVSDGYVRVYKRNGTGTEWAQLGSDIDGEASCDRSGWSVALSADGTIVAVGAPFNDGSTVARCDNVDNNNSGHVRVYQWDGTNWAQLGSDIDGRYTSGNELLGSSVALSADGTVVAIGATRSTITVDDSNTLTRTGCVRVYKFNNNNSEWVQRGSDIYGEASDDGSGESVALSADGYIVAIGASSNDGDSGVAYDQDSGHVRVYKWEKPEWVQRGADIDGEDGYDFAGSSVALSADGAIVAVAAPAKNDYKGLVRVYEWNGTDSWATLGSDIFGKDAGEYAGWSVALSGDGTTAAIGAPGKWNGNTSGDVRVYDFINSSWVQRGDDIDGEAGGDNAGFSVALSADGAMVAIGARFNDGTGDIINSGHVRVYDFLCT